MNPYLVTSESVTEGHPDKLCDQISDGILDAYLSQDPYSRVAVETMASSKMLFIAGEVSSEANVDICAVAKDVATQIGYCSDESGLNPESCLVLTNVHQQSPDISQGVGRDNGIIGAGDQGIMYGFACDESKTYMPLTQYLSAKLTLKLAEVRKNGSLHWLYPDGKSQVTMQYDRDGNPQKLTSIIISAHHMDGINQDFIREEIENEVIYAVIGREWIDHDTRILINPTGSFSVGGPAADTGLTGRKIMVDTYGGVSRHGGGAFSGKDPTKVDRSAAYMARYVAKNIVAAKLARRCEVALAYSIGQPEPEMIHINTFGTGILPEDEIQKIVSEMYCFSVKEILTKLNLRTHSYLKTASYGHFGREDVNFSWEELNLVDQLKEQAIYRMAKKLM
ncbi:MAG: methionine adenosyltransferase [Clostridiales Family XIII bacterium]|jgi:S-adenosylmethionine synthetase|nr:methionine adenosyltransferase [Clostridiales Family XIII bacterium]